MVIRKFKSVHHFKSEVNHLYLNHRSKFKNSTSIEQLLEYDINWIKNN